MERIDKSMVHLINKKGERKVMPWAERKKMNESQEETDDKFYFDTEWYLSHGCVTLEQHEEKMKELLKNKDIIIET